MGKKKAKQLLEALGPVIADITACGHCDGTCGSCREDAGRILEALGRAEVFILQQILPYDYDHPIVGVFTSVQAAQADRPEVKRWFQDVNSPDVWVSNNDPRNTAPYWAIERFPVRSK